MTDLIYRPHHIRERLTITKPDGSTVLIGCSDSSTAMLVDAVSLGATRITEAGVRKLSSEPTPDPESPGLNIPQCLEVLRDLRIVGTVDRTGDDWGAFIAALDDERRALIQLDNWILNDCGRSHVGHMVFAQAHRSRGLLLNNPMCSVAKWYRPSVIRAAMEAFANSTKVPGDGLRFAISKRVPRVGTAG